MGQDDLAGRVPHIAELLRELVGREKVDNAQSTRRISVSIVPLFSVFSIIAEDRAKVAYEDYCFMFWSSDVCHTLTDMTVIGSLTPVPRIRTR